MSVSTEKGNICVVFFCDEKYFNKFLETCEKLVSVGEYTGDICLIINEYLHEVDIYNHPFITKHNIICKYYKKIEFSDRFHYYASKRDRYNLLIQYQKFFIWDVFFKKWNYIFYMDCGMRIYRSIKPMLNLFNPGCFYGHSDSYHDYKWDLNRQFAKDAVFDDLNRTLKEEYGDLHVDYCQGAINLFDTCHIQENTVAELIALAEKFPNTWCNEQGIVALYFLNVWKQIPLFNPENARERYYDSLLRFKDCNYIMNKEYQWFVNAQTKHHYEDGTGFLNDVIHDSAIFGVKNPKECIVPRSRELKHTL